MLRRFSEATESIGSRDQRADLKIGPLGRANQGRSFRGDHNSFSFQVLPVVPVWLLLGLSCLVTRVGALIRIPDNFAMLELAHPSIVIGGVRFISGGIAQSTLRP